MPTLHKTAIGVGIVPISIFSNMRIGTQGDGWSETEVLTNDLTKPRGWMRAGEGRGKKESCSGI